MRLPPICLDHEYFLGDTVLLEALASYLAQYHESVSVSSDYPGIFDNHPAIIGINREEPIPDNTELIDMSPSVRGATKGNLPVNWWNALLDRCIPSKLPSLRKFVRYDTGLVIHEKLASMCESLGLKKHYLSSPKIYLSPSELEIAERVAEQFPGRRVGIAVETSMPDKNWPKMEKFVRQQSNRNQHICLFCKDKSVNVEILCKYAVVPFYDQSLRETMAHIAAMDIMVGPDTGLMHMAAALGVPIVVIGFDWFEEIYDLYANCDYIKVPMWKSGMKLCSHRRVGRRMRKMLNCTKEPSVDASHVPAVRNNAVRSDIAIFRLDGMGGTITMADQAKKICEITGVKPDLVVRGFASLFKKNPHVNNVIEVGPVVWGECLAEMLDLYDTVAEIRFCPAKWHQKGHKWFDQNFTPLQKIFDDFPLGYKTLESYGLHHVQLTSKILGLPYDEIEMEIYNIEKYNGDLPERFVVMANGVDGMYKGAKQTKSWEHWDSLLEFIDAPVVQVGLSHDQPVDGAIDLRGKTSLPQLCDVLQRANVVACNEGGIMHLSYALRCENVLILRGPTRGRLFEYPGQTQIDSFVCEICWGDTEDWYINCPRGIDAVCMKTIIPERVAMNIQEVLS